MVKKVPRKEHKRVNPSGKVSNVRKHMMKKPNGKPKKIKIKNDWSKQELIDEIDSRTVHKVDIKDDMVTVNGVEVDTIESLEDYQNISEEDKKDLETYGDEMTQIIEEIVWEARQEAPATIQLYEGGSDKVRRVITEFENEMEDEGYDFDLEWKKTDGWRGYYEVKSKDFVPLHSDAILSGHSSEKRLKDFDDRMIEELKQRSLTFARVFTRTSNVFSTGYDLMVLKKDKEKVKDVVKEIARQEGVRLD